MKSKRRRVQLQHGRLVTSDAAIHDMKDPSSTSSFQKDRRSVRHITVMDTSIVKELVNIPADGNCLFSAISVALGSGPECSPSVLRSKSIEWIKSNWSEEMSVAINIAHNQGSHDGYIKYMSNNGTFADEPEVTALSHVVNRPIMVIGGSSNAARKISEVNPDLPGPPVILYLNDQHYSLVMNKYRIGDWVLVRYDDVEYPGEITGYSFTGYKVNVMEKKGGYYTWPTVPDDIYYPEMDILKRLSPPDVARSRGQYKFSSL